MAVLIRKATMTDAKALHAMIVESARSAMVLPRPLSKVYGHLRDFFVAQDDSGRILGCCSLSITWDNLAELRSLVVIPEARGADIGRKLVRACLDEAVLLGIGQVFVLTNIDGFFTKCGFKETDKGLLPQKVWADCINCPQFPDCDEIPMSIEITINNNGEK